MADEIKISELPNQSALQEGDNFPANRADDMGNRHTFKAQYHGDRSLRSLVLSSDNAIAFKPGTLPGSTLRGYLAPGPNVATRFGSLIEGAEANRIYVGSTAHTLRALYFASDLFLFSISPVPDTALLTDAVLFVTAGDPLVRVRIPLRDADQLLSPLNSDNQDLNFQWSLTHPAVDELNTAIGEGVVYASIHRNPEDVNTNIGALGGPVIGGLSQPPGNTDSGTASSPQSYPPGVTRETIAAISPYRNAGTNEYDSGALVLVPTTAPRTGTVTLSTEVGTGGNARKIVVHLGDSGYWAELSGGNAVEGFGIDFVVTY